MRCILPVLWWSAALLEVFEAMQARHTATASTADIKSCQLHIPRLRTSPPSLDRPNHSPIIPRLPSSQLLWILVVPFVLLYIYFEPLPLLPRPSSSSTTSLPPSTQSKADEMAATLKHLKVNPKEAHQSTVIFLHVS